MNEKLNIRIEPVTRIEGHGAIVLNAENGKIENIKWEVLEAPRFFETIVLGKSYKHIAQITSRICGICSIGHYLAALKAIENAMNVKVSDQTVLLRKLALHGENIQSHILHIGYLAVPDMFGLPSVLPLVRSNVEIVKKIISIHKMANFICDVVCGRTTHPVAMDVGGFKKVPTIEKLTLLKNTIEKEFTNLKHVVSLILTIIDKIPDFNRETEYIALSNNNEYALYDGTVMSSDTGALDVSNYENIVNEYTVEHSTAKYTKHKRESYMVGALARFNLNCNQLHEFAKNIARRTDLKAPCYNPFMNTIAQLVEIAHSMEDAVIIIENLLLNYKFNEPKNIETRTGRGIGAVEVPRGLLFHDYTFDENGICTKANCVIPTNQNHANIQKDLEALTPTIISKDRADIERTLEMLVRAYDPCVSCSTHYLKVNYK
jgi:coenzyme F420-reducing hydrogenase alpha subunit